MAKVRMIEAEEHWIAVVAKAARLPISAAAPVDAAATSVELPIGLSTEEEGGEA
jgi:hypothetical protein